MQSALLRTIAWATLAAVGPVQAQLPRATPEEVGLSTERLALIGPAMQRFVDQGAVAGIVTMVARRGRLVHWEAVGFRDLESRAALEPNDIFRIYSMTKPITSVAVMMLVEAGALALDDPVSRYLPEFAGVKVMSSGALIAPDRPITIANLLSHTSGITYGLFGNTPVDSMYRAAGIFSGDLETMTRKVGGLPLLGHPGSVWNYGVSTDILGRVVEVVSGQAFDDFLKTRILTPLGMRDTDFFVSPEKTGRFTTNYAASPNGLRVTDSPTRGNFNTKPALLSGGGGLVGTAADYVRFAQMLLNGGELDGVRILRPETVRLMRTNRLQAELIPIRISVWRAPGYGFGLGFSVLVDEEASPVPDNNGVFRWWGAASTYFWIDPEAELIGLVMTQLLPSTQPRIESDFQTFVYQAIAK